MGRGELVCRAEDLKEFLQQLAGQIADADRRHSESLREMQQRLARLGGQTELMKSNLPQHYASAFERIESGMALLAERLVEADQERVARANTVEPAAPSAVSAASVEPVRSTPGMPPSEGPAITFVEPDELPPPAPAQSSYSALASETWSTLKEPPPALRSAVGGSGASWSRAAPVAEQEPKSAEPVYRQNPDEPWDRHSADALARLYDSGEPGLPPLRSTFDTTPITPVVARTVDSVERTGASAPLAATPSFAANLGSSEPIGPAIDQLWLETRFSDITARVRAVVGTTQS